MNRDIVQGHWRELKGKVKQQWGKFTDDEVSQMRGSYEELAGALQKKYGYEKDRAKTEIETFLERYNIHEDEKF